MKKIVALLFFCLYGMNSYSQITVTNADFASAGDTARFSTASPMSAVDLTLTGANYTWDFSFLQPVSQDVDTFLSVTSTPFVYVLVFGLSSNVAKKGFDLSALPAVPVSDIYNFYNRSSNNYRQTGFGASVSGITTPLSFNSPDIIYDFPVNFGNIDSSDSDYSLAIPGLASAVGSQRRVNTVDGWGSVTTPYGTFNALRIKSTITGEDSLFLDTLGQGFAAPRPLTREYKWLANGQDIPVLEIVTSELVAGVETVNSIRYKDSIRTTGLNAIPYLSGEPALSPNPSRNHDVLATIDLKQPAVVGIFIRSIEGKLLDQKSVDLNSGKQNILVKSSSLSLSPGVYLVSFVVQNEQFTTRMVVE
jgi:hypothetical protein